MSQPTSIATETYTFWSVVIIVCIVMGVLFHGIIQESEQLADFDKLCSSNGGIAVKTVDVGHAVCIKPEAIFDQLIHPIGKNHGK